MSFLKLSFFVFSFCLYINDVIGAELKIKSVDELITFKNNVNKGTNYSGTTVFLDSDIDFTGETFEPIGKDWDNYFLGVFDGQGHVVSNLKMTSSLKYVGLFGDLRGLTIKNVILDSSCSITSSYSGSYDAYVGGFIGYCYARYGPCTIENSVNMGSVTFSRTSDYDLSLGGIAGELYSSYGYVSTVKNCANYGGLTHSGTSKYSYIGGVVGYSSGDSDNNKRVYIYNSLNHGTITHKGTTSSRLYLGGIAGSIKYTTIENCVSAGKISTPRTSLDENIIGSIVGRVQSDTSINYCYFTSEQRYKKYGYEQEVPTESNTLSYDSTTFELNGTVSVGSYTGDSLIGALNGYSDYYTLRDYSHWLLNKNNNDVSFNINGRSSFTLNSQIILLPSLGSEEKLWFDGWYEDSVLTTSLKSYEITIETELYGRFEVNTNNYIITFDTRVEGVSVEPITAPFNSVVTLPSDSIREHCTFGWWENKYGEKVESSFTIPSRNITLYAVWKCTRIETPDDLISFSKIVNSGTTYKGTTVLLDSGIDLTGKFFEPIGKDWDNYFLGVFDGQGHVVSNLKMTSSLKYVGLFGYSEGLTIRNVILDPSCSITSSLSGSSHAYVGGIIGDCYARYGDCTIENNVNMGSLTFDGNISSGSYLYLGGIGGYLESYWYGSTVKNCANYGDITHSGTSSSSYIGGIVGYSEGDSSDGVYIYNSLNHGSITHNDTTSSDLYLGGIAGHTLRTTIENCVSAGKISTPTKASNTNYIGNIVGMVSSYTTINYCYFSSDLSAYNKYGYTWKIPSESNTFSYDNTTFELNGTVSVGSYTGDSLIGALNGYSDYYTLRDYSHWLLNKNNNDVSFTINGKTNPIWINYKIILMPSPASEGSMAFDGWYEDNELTTPLTTYEVTRDTELYGRYCTVITVTLDANGGNELDEKEMVIGCDRVYGDLPEPMRTGYTFAGWFTERDGGDDVESGDIVTNLNAHTLYAHWTANKYTVTFNVNGGNPLSESGSEKNVTYNEEYGDLPEPTRAGYTFAGWFTERDGGDKVESGDIVTNLNDHTLYAHWTVESKSESKQGSDSQYESDSQHGSGGKHESDSDSKQASFSLPSAPSFSFLFL